MIRLKLSWYKIGNILNTLFICIITVLLILSDGKWYEVGYTHSYFGVYLSVRNAYVTININYGKPLNNTYKSSNGFRYYEDDTKWNGRQRFIQVSKNHYNYENKYIQFHRGPNGGVMVNELNFPITFLYIISLLFIVFSLYWFLKKRIENNQGFEILPINNSIKKEIS